MVEQTHCIVVNRGTKLVKKKIEMRTHDLVWESFSKKLRNFDKMLRSGSKRNQCLELLPHGKITT